MARLEQIESIFHQALECPPSERESFVLQACADDPELHREVSSLITSYGEDAPFGPWAAADAAEMISVPAPLAVGERVGPYEIVSFIAAGGMGAVYRAHDPRTGREVAIKISSERFSEHLEHEVRTVAALNHPNIATLYDVGPNYLVMELVEGESPKGPLPLETALKYALQIADALEAAHERGITHRDLKPANIRIKPDGTVKVLDFGLAKTPVLAGSADEGMILGTAGYMSPEQARGKPVDKRADIWAFGVLLHEMLTGQRMFEGETTSEVIEQVLTKEPDLSRIPTKVRKLLSRCLERDPKRRLRDIGEARFLLEEAPAQAAPPRLPWILAAAALAAAIGLGFAAYRYFSQQTGGTNLLRLPVLVPEKTTFNYGSVPALSPNGHWLAISAIVNGQQALWVRDLDTLTWRLLADTDGAMYPFWSPDSRWIGFFTTSGKLTKIEVSGGPAVPICDANAGRGGTWSQDDVIVYATNGGGLFRVSATGKTPPVQLSNSSEEPGWAGHRTPWFLPDGRHFLYTARAIESENARIFIADIESTNHMKDRRAVLVADSNAIYVPPGYVLFVRGRTLMVQSFDASTFQATGDAVPLAEGVDYHLTSTYAFSASKTGLITYISGGRKAQMTWFDRGGRPLETLGPVGEPEWAAISPDGSTVAYDRLDEQTGNYDIWLHDVTTQADLRFTHGPFSNRFPVWSPDGSHLAFSSTVPKNISIYQRAITGMGDKEPLDNDGTPNFKRASDWSRNYLIEVRNTNGIWLLPMNDEKKPFAYVDTEFTESDAALSPNGRWLAYSSDASKRTEVYVETFPTRGTQWRVSVNGGSLPRWSRNGKELYFIAPDRKLMVVEVDGGPKLVRGKPKPLFDTRLPTNGRYDVSKDGLFLIPTTIESTGTTPMTLIVNWTAALEK